MFKERPFNVLIFCFIVTLCTAVLQYILPDFDFFDGGLITAILLTIFLKEDKYTIFFGIISVALVLLSYFYEHEGISAQRLIMQQMFSAVIMMLTTIAVLYVKKLYRSMESDQLQKNALFEHATEGIILTNGKGEIILVNPAGERLFRYSREELLGKKVEALIPSRFHGNHSGYREQFGKSPSYRQMGHGRDLFARDKFGNEFPVEVSLSHYRQNNESFVIAFVVDITQRKESEKHSSQQREQLEKVSREIRQLNSELETKVRERTLILQEALQELEQSQKDLHEALNKEKELNEIKSRFVSMASHEFRTPLSSVLSSASLLGRYTKTEEQENRDRHIHRIKDSVKHLNDLLEDFLSLGKLEEGKVQTQTDWVQIKPFLDDVADEMKAILKKGQHIEVEMPEAVELQTDKKLLKNILINLIGNAIKFSPENAPITVGAFKKNGQLCISVKDEGMGISEEDQQHLFTSFFRGKNVTNIQGTGLGLHIVKRYVDLLQGTIDLKSELDRGTTISFSIPAAPAVDNA